MFRAANTSIYHAHTLRACHCSQKLVQMHIRLGRYNPSIKLRLKSNLSFGGVNFLKQKNRAHCNNRIHRGTIDKMFILPGVPINSHRCQLTWVSTHGSRYGLTGTWPTLQTLIHIVVCTNTIGYYRGATHTRAHSRVAREISSLLPGLSYSSGSGWTHRQLVTLWTCEYSSSLVSHTPTIAEKRGVLTHKR